MCEATPPRPQLSDAIPSADTMTELGDRLQQPGYVATIGDAARCYMVAATLRRLSEHVAQYTVDEGVRRSVLSTLTQVRALAETERQHGNSHWTRAVLLIDNAIEELDL